MTDNRTERVYKGNIIDRRWLIALLQKLTLDLNNEEYIVDKIFLGEGGIFPEVFHLKYKNGKQVSLFIAHENDKNDDTYIEIEFDCHIVDVVKNNDPYIFYYAKKLIDILRKSREYEIAGKSDIEEFIGKDFAESHIQKYPLGIDNLLRTLKTRIENKELATSYPPMIAGDRCAIINIFDPANNTKIELTRFNNHNDINYSYRLLINGKVISFQDCTNITIYDLAKELYDTAEKSCKSFDSRMTADDVQKFMQNNKE